MSRAMLARKAEAAPAAPLKTAAKSSSGALRIGEPDDAFEQEADRVADAVMAGKKSGPQWSLSRMSVAPPLQRECACGGPTGAGGECENCKEKKSLQRKATGALQNGEAPPIVHEVLSSPGSPLDQATRNFFEPRFGHDFSKVRVHADQKSAESAKSVNALAYTVGNHVVFGTGEYAPEKRDRSRLMAHELTHVVQQAAGVPENGRLRIGSVHDAFEKEANKTAEIADASQNAPAGARLTHHAMSSLALQRYESGEHAKFGETGEILKKLTSDRAFAYKVKPGEMPKQIAAKFGITEDELRSANSSKLKHWKAVANPEKKVEGFNAGDEIIVPPILNAATKEALKARELTVMVNGVSMPYGVGIALGDFYESPEQMMAASPTELKNLSLLIQYEKSGHKISDADWDLFTKKRYSELALKNESHFAPPNSKLVPDSGKSTRNHKTEWENTHKAALEKSQAGDKDKAMATNAFADHFLTDAFAAGHLINKRDVGEMFEGQLPKITPKPATGDEFTPGSKAFFDAIAKGSFTGSVKVEFSKWETVACYDLSHNEVPCGNLMSGHATMDTEDHFSGLLQGIHLKKPELFENAVVKGIHDTLNKRGVPVENEKGDKWHLSGDGTLNPKSLEIGRKAVAQSQLNVLDVFKMANPLNLPSLFKKVWDFVPRPTAGAGEATVQSEIASGTDPKSPGLVKATVNLIKTYHKSIIEKLVAMKVLEKA